MDHQHDTGKPTPPRLFTYLINLIPFQLDNLSGLDRPCLYRWGNWSNCTGTCYDITRDKKPPNKTRRVDQASIVHARGRFKKWRDCPKELEKMEDSAPCNVDR